jgi:hypothetical protein
MFQYFSAVLAVSIKSGDQEISSIIIIPCFQCYDEWEAVLKQLKQTDETESSEGTDTPEHRRRGISQTGSIEPSTSLISNDMLMPRDTEEAEEELERDDHTDTGDQSDSTRPKGETDSGGGNRKDPGRQNATSLPGLFDEEDPESNELFGSTS